MSSASCEDRIDDEKRKTRNENEKKRRDQFNDLIDELMTLVGSGGEKKMDKALVLRKTIELLKNHKEMKKNQDPSAGVSNQDKPSFLSAAEYWQLMLEALDGFIVVLSVAGGITFVSEAVTAVLGQDPSCMISKSILSYVHPSECAEVKNHFDEYMLAHSLSSQLQSDVQLEFHCHMLHSSIKHSEDVSYSHCKVSGSFVPSEKTMAAESNESLVLIIHVVNPIVCKNLITLDKKNNEFVSRLSLEWKFLYLDHRASSIIGYFPFEVLGMCAYDYNHFDDLEELVGLHQQLMEYGEITSDYYRFLTKGQQWIWMKTHFYVSFNQWNSKPEFVVCTNTVYSYIDVIREKKREISSVKGRSSTSKPASDIDFASDLIASIEEEWTDEHQNHTLQRAGLSEFDVPKPNQQAVQFSAVQAVEAGCANQDFSHNGPTSNEMQLMKKQEELLEMIRSQQYELQSVRRELAEYRNLPWEHHAQGINKNQSISYSGANAFAYSNISTFR